MSIQALVRREHVLAELPRLGYCWTGEVQMHCISPTAEELKTPAQYAVMEKEALEVAQEMKAEYWAVSSLTDESESSGLPLWDSCLPGLSLLPLQVCPMTPGLELLPQSILLLPMSGENVRDFFCVAALIFEANVLAELEKSGAQRTGDVVRVCPPG